MAEDDRDRAPAEVVLRRSLIDETGLGRPLSRRSTQRQRSVESYLRGEMLPRYIQRAADIERATREHERELARVHRRLREEHPGDAAGFAAAWADRVAGWRFDAVNRLIAEHNAWYPVERDLPMDPRTGDYVLVGGRPYRRRPLDAAWVHEQHPAAPSAG